MLYCCNATRVTESIDSNGNTYRGFEQVPTFFLESKIQGIKDIDHATKIALKVIGGLGHVTVTPVS